jgi:oxepin-CoA hydrolase/3-oxo-5,6-dehydrosuberyl-CoA semialdehyde dehydrogenase
MKTLNPSHYAQEGWYQASGGAGRSAERDHGEDVIATTGSQGLDFKAMLDHARQVGGPALRRMTFHERAHMLKALANAIMARKEELYELNYQTGATRTDGWIDIEGGAGTLFSFSSKGRRELPNSRVLIDGNVEPLSKGGSFVGQHVWTRCRASPSTSTRSTSPSGACSRSSARRSWRACP